MRKKRKPLTRHTDGSLIERLAITEAYRDAWYAAALEMAEQLMRDPETRKEVDLAILRVLQKMESLLSKRIGQ